MNSAFRLAVGGTRSFRYHRLLGRESTAAGCVGCGENQRAGDAGDRNEHGRGTADDEDDGLRDGVRRPTEVSNRRRSRK